MVGVSAAEEEKRGSEERKRFEVRGPEEPNLVSLDGAADCVAKLVLHELGHDWE